MKLKLIIGFLLLVFTQNITAGGQVDIDKANKAYIAGFYENSIAIYEKIISDGMTSSELYYNLGNAYFKSNNLPSAILNYERALKLKPGDEDIVYNLGIANNRIVDKIDVLPELFYIRWWKSLKTNFSPDGWAILSISCFALLLLVGGLFLLSGSVNTRKIYFTTGAMLIVINILAGIITWQTNRDSGNQHTAIVFTPTLPVKSSPDDTSIDLFVVHEGLKVWVMDTLGEWNEIKIANGNKGWVKSDNLKRI